VEKCNILIQLDIVVQGLSNIHSVPRAAHFHFLVY